VILRHLIEFVPYATFYRLTSKPPKRSPQKTSSAQMPAPADAPKSAGVINEPNFSDFYEKLLVSEGASPETTAYDLDHYSASSQKKFSIEGITLTFAVKDYTDEKWSIDVDKAAPPRVCTLGLWFSPLKDRNDVKRFVWLPRQRAAPAS